MLGLLRINNLPQQTSAQGGTAIIDDRRSLGGIVTLEVAGAVLAQGCGFGEARGAAARIHTLCPLVPAIRSAARKPLAFTIQDIANSLPAGGAAVACQVAGASSRGVRGSPAVCTTEGEKKFCCVTTRRRKFWALSDLGRGLGPLAALSLCLGVLGFGVGVGVLATFSLPLRRQPAADLSQAFRILAVSLVPTPRLILASAPFVQAGPRAGRRALALGRCFPLTWWLPTGGSISQGKARGECDSILSGRNQNANKTIACKSTVFSENKTETKTVLEKRSEKDARIESRSGGSHQKLVTGSHSSRGISTKPIPSSSHVARTPFRSGLRSINEYSFWMAVTD